VSDELERKRRFARAMLRQSSPWDAICYAIPDPVAEAEGVDRWTLALDWKVDETVRALMAEIVEAEGDDALGLPTRVDFILGMWQRLQATQDPESYAKLGKLYGEVRGWMQEPSSASSAPPPTVVVQVMQVPMARSVEEWEHIADRNQKVLTTHGEPSH
jgi:hypothetical protein